MITFFVEEISECEDVVHFQLSAKLPKADWFGKGDPYFEISRLREDNKWVKCLQSETIKNTKKPQWKQQSLKMQVLNNGDAMRPIRITVWDWEKNDEPDLYGYVDTSVDEMAGGSKTLNLVNKKKKKQKDVGVVIVNRCQVEKRHGFTEYLAGGMDLSLMVAIDFTGSNGHPNDFGSLHHRDQQRLSPYLRAIRSIGDIVSSYDSDGHIPTYGFGAVVNGRVDHCFPLNLSQNPELPGVKGIEAAYHHILDNDLIQFSGPTLFQKVLSNSSAVAKRPWAQGKVHYNILLILTDGVINDMAQTIDALVAASQLPMSIIIVGIGTADFDQMEFLDGDAKGLKDSRGRWAERDIVQFVPFRKFAQMGPTALAEETLREVPGQLLSYMRKHGIEPPPKTQAQSRDAIEQQLMSQPSIQATQAPPPMGPPPSADDGLPPGWQEAKDPSTGRPYYINHQTQQTTWERPRRGEP